jgi:hypothetical protein
MTGEFEVLAEGQGFVMLGKPQSSIRRKPQSSILRFWAHLAGNVHPHDEAVFAAHPDHTFKLQFPPTLFVGHVDAPIVILMMNGSYAPGKTEDEFPKPFIAEYIKYIREGEVPPHGEYYESLSYRKLINAGKAVLVNAVPYRSVKLSEEYHNRRVAKLLPSLAAHRRWLKEEVLPEAECGDRFVLAHRAFDLWDIRKEEYAGPNVIFSPDWRRKAPSNENLRRALDWLRHRGG